MADLNSILSIIETIAGESAKDLAGVSPSTAGYIALGDTILATVQGLINLAKIKHQKTAAAFAAQAESATSPIPPAGA